MNVLIRRLGIPIKTIQIQGDRARIGSGEDCEISLSDPYLAPVVAEIVRRGGEWYIVDTGSSLEGVRLGDQKIVEELFEPGELFLVGGFEILREGTPGQRRTQHRTSAAGAESIPQTMYQAKLEALPGTVVQSLDEIRAEILAQKQQAEPQPHADSKARLAFRRLATLGGAKQSPGAAPPAAGRRSRLRVILLVAGILFGLLILAAIIGGSDSGKPAATATTATAPAATPKAEATPPPAPRPAGGDQAAMKLDLPNAFAGWEAELKAGDSPALRRKIVTGALEIGRAYAAAGDPRAKDYLDLVVRYGAPEGPEVAVARERLQVIRK